MESKLSIYSDGGARGNPGPAACGVVFSKDGKVVFKGSKFLGETTNNVAEYRGVIFALETLSKNREWSADAPVDLFLDSELIAHQLNGKYKIKNQLLATLSFEVKKLEKHLSTKIIYQHIPRSKNSIADFLVNEELDKHQ
ncbi:ribonuclease HI family protein [Patescibacteria group bacterium]|nr:ribonuclease HI family protein [Patescibacteria group bacterium]